MSVFSYGLKARPDIKATSLFTIALPVLVGTIGAIMLLKLGVLALGVVIALVALPWFVREPFRLYLLLIVTWPVLGLYIQVSLPAGIPDLNYERILVLGIVALVMIPALAFKKKVPAVGIWVGLYFGAQTIAYGLAGLSGADEAANLAIFINSLLLPLAMYWLTKTFITSRQRLRWLLGALILASVIICASGLYERALDLKASPFPVETGTASGERYLDEGLAGGRAAGVTGNPAIYGAILGIGALASMGMTAHARQGSPKIGWAAVTLLLVYGVFVSFTRSAWLAFLAAVIVAQFLIKDLGQWTTRLFLLGMIVGTVLLFFAFGDQLMKNEVVQGRILEQQNVTGRLDRAALAWERFGERPLFGWGAGALNAFTKQKFPQGGFDSSHNTYLTMLVDSGIFMLGIFLALPSFWLRQAVQVWRRSQRQSFERSVVGVMLGSFVIFLLSGLALELKYFGYLNALFWIAGATIECLYAMLDGDHQTDESYAGNPTLTRPRLGRALIWEGQRSLSAPNQSPP
jgi:hypothetical protein